MRSFIVHPSVPAKKCTQIFRLRFKKRGADRSQNNLQKIAGRNGHNVVL